MSIKKIKILLLILGLTLLNSCTSKKELLYFSDVNVTAHDKITFSPSKIQPNDILSILKSQI